MSASHRLPGHVDEQAGLDDRRRPGGRVHDSTTQQARTVTGNADPRLAHAGASATGLMALQRSAGNAAVASLVGQRPMVQRDVTIDQVDTSIDTAPGATPTADGDNPVSSSGGTTTISGSQINLDAAMTSTAGVIRADTIIANSVVGASYTPGAGNEW